MVHYVVSAVVTMNVMHVLLFVLHVCVQGLPNLIGRWLPTGQPSIAIWLPDKDWWLPNMARHEMVTFGG